MTPVFFRVFQLVLKKIAQGFFAHEHAVDDFALQQRHLLLEHVDLAVFGDQLHPHVAGLVQRQALFAMVEVAVAHV